MKLMRILCRYIIFALTPRVYGSSPLRWPKGLESSNISCKNVRFFTSQISLLWLENVILLFWKQKVLNTVSFNDVFRQVAFQAVCNVNVAFGKSPLKTGFLFIQFSLCQDQNKENDIPFISKME